MFINNFDPVAFQVFSIEIRWYSLSYILGLIIGWIYCKKFIIKDQERKKLFDDYIAYLIFGIIIGGRLGYVFIYNPKYFLNNLSEIPMIWNGGMSFHGAVIGIIVSTIIFSKKYNQKIFYFLDLIAISSPIGIFLGRISNFLNSELYGRPAELPWSVIFIKVDNINRHPSQLYEAISEGLILFILMQMIYKKFSENKGLTSAFFIIFYSIFRFFIEFTREPDSHIGLVLFNLSMGQLISVAALLIGILLWQFKKNV